VSAVDPSCRILRSLEGYAGAWQVQQPSVGEESITDWLLYECARRIPRVYYHKFTRSEEAKETGADWDWCILTSRGAFTMRVQAKRTRPLEDVYPGLARSNRHGLQSELLLESSKLEGLRPVYAFYCEPKRGYPMACRQSQTTTSGQSIFLAPAGWVYYEFIQKGRRKVAPSDVLLKAIPIQCIACCTRNPAGLGMFFATYFAAVDGPTDLGLPADLGMATETPSWATFLSRGPTRAPISQVLDVEFRGLSDRTGALLLWDLRENGT
jgi:hypothetical protein